MQTGEGPNGPLRGRKRKHVESKGGDEKKYAEDCYAKILKTVMREAGTTTLMSDKLETYCRKNFGPEFVGVFSRDEIPKLRVGQGCIVNNQVRAQGGEHWVGLAKCKDGKVLEYDSFGREDFLKLGKGVSRDTERDVEQADAETNCGNRCVAFLAVFFWGGEECAQWI